LGMGDRVCQPDRLLGPQGSKSCSESVRPYLLIHPFPKPDLIRF
jgi:hypothetical protein